MNKQALTRLQTRSWQGVQVAVSYAELRPWPLPVHGRGFSVRACAKTSATRETFDEEPPAASGKPLTRK
jgi:hypothetical protein